MSNLLNPDNAFFSGINKIIDTAWLGVLWTVISVAPAFCCFLTTNVPVFIAGLVVSAVLVGPASTALYYATVKVIRRSRSYATVQFFKSFKTNFKVAAPMSLIYCVFAYLMYVDFQYANLLADEGKSSGNVFFVVFLAGSIFALITLTWAFPILSRFTVNLPQLVRNSMILSTKHIVRSLILAALWIGELLLIETYVPLAYYIFIPLVIPGGTALVRSLIIEPVLKKYLGDSEGSPEETGIDEWYRE